MYKWLIAVFVIISLVVFGIFLDKPRGTLVGSVYLQTVADKDGKFVYNTDNIKDSGVRVIAYGPVVRASYVTPEGKYRIDGLPIGKYSVKVKANGYQSKTQWGVKVEEALETVVKPVNLSFSSSLLNLSSDMKVFTTSEDPYFWFNAGGIGNVNLKLYSFNPQKHFNLNKKDLSRYLSFLQGNYYYGSNDLITSLYKDKKPLYSWDRKVVYGIEEYANVPFKIDNDLKEGAYLLVAEAEAKKDKKKLTDVYYFTVSDVGLIAKQDPEKLLMKVVDLKTLKSLPDVNLDVYDKTGDFKQVAQLKTNKEGMVEYVYNKNLAKTNATFFVVANKGHAIAINSSYSWYYSDNKYRVYSYTERPIYRPDQTVFFKGIVRTVTKEGLKNIPGQDVTVKIYNPDSDQVKSMNLKTNQYGTYTGLVDIPENTPLGNYRITAIINGNEYDSYFEVAEYRKPEYTVDVIPGSKVLIGGSKATATIKSNYLFGYPVTNAKVKYTVYASPNYSLKWNLLPRPDYYSFYDDWSDEESDYLEGGWYGSSSGDIIAEGYAVTNNFGEAKITFDTKKISPENINYFDYEDNMPQRYKVEAEVTDITRKTSTGNASFNVVSGSYALYLEPKNYIATIGQDLLIDVKAIDYNRNPVSAKVDISIQRWVWNQKDWTYEKTKLNTGTSVETKSDGNAVARITIPDKFDSGTYKIVAESKDSVKNTVLASSYIWVSNNKMPFKDNEKTGNLKISFDKKVYKPGDTLKMLISSPVKDIQALLTIEGETIYSYKTIDIDKYTQLIELPVKREYLPNVYISLSLVGPKKQFYTQTKMLKVTPDNNFLNVTLKPNKEKYKPQDEVEYTVIVKDNDGNPAQAELSFGVVDESIYLIREDFTPDIKKFFYKKRMNLVNTSYSFSPGYSAGNDKIQPRVRKDFKDTAYWNARVVTDENGLAKIKFKVPDNLTTWRTTVRAITKDTKVASAIDKILVTQDIIVRLALPRFYTVGDQPILAAIVSNYTDKLQALQLKLDLPHNIALLFPDEKPELFVDVKSQEQYRKDWTLSVKKAGKTKIKASALSSTIVGDAVEREIEILPYGVKKNELASGRLIDQEASYSIESKIEKEAVPGSVSWKLNLSPSNASMILGSLDYLVSYPYGCTEQTMSRFLPGIVVDNVSKTLGVKLNNKTMKKLPKVISDSLSRLYKFQHYDGGWGWWEYDSSDLYMTAYVLYGFKYAVNSGYYVEKYRINNALAWLKKHMDSELVLKLFDNIDTKDYNRTYELSDLSYALYVLALFDVDKPKLADNMYKHSEKLSNEALAYLALANAELGNNSKAKRLVDKLLSRVNVVLPIVGFGMTKSVLEKLGINLSSLYCYNSVEISSIALRAILKVESENPIIERIVPYLVENRTGSYWYNTKTTASVVLALSEYIKSTLNEDQIDYSVLVELNGELIDRVIFDKSNIFKGDVLVEIPENLIKKHNELKLVKSGEGKFFYSSEFNYYQLYKPDEIIPMNSENGVKITKEFFGLKSTVDKYGDIKYQEYPLNSTIKAGDMLLVRLILQNDKPVQYVIVEDPKISGMELVSDDPRSKLGNNYDSSSDHYWWDYWWTHQEDRDTKMAFFVKNLKAGKHQLNYLIRAEMPGKYLMNPTYTSGMYSDSVSGSSSSSRLEVVE